MKKEIVKTKVEAHDRNASFAAMVFRFVMSLIIISTFIILVVNTIKIATTSVGVYLNNKNNTMEKYAKGFYSKDSYYSDMGIINSSEALKDLNTNNVNNYMYFTLYEMVVLEIFSVFILIYAYYMYVFLSVDNLNNAFSEQSIKIFNKVIKYRVLALFVPFLLSCIGNLISSGLLDNYPSLGNGEIDIADIFILFVLYIVRYIIQDGKNKIKE